MRYSTEPKYKNYAKEYGFLSFARKCGDNYRKKNNGYCNKNWNRCCKKEYLKKLQKLLEI